MKPNNITTKHMKAKLTFNLPEDQHEWDNAVNSNAMYLALWDLSQELRSMWKYQQYKTEEEYAIVDTIRDKFHEILQEHNINLDK